MINVLVACEESQAVTKYLRKFSINAFSCDIQDCSGNLPEYHLKKDALKEVYKKNKNGTLFYHAVIAFPPCTYLSSVQTHICRKDSNRVEKRIEAAMFFMNLYNAPQNYVMIENPAGVMKHIFRDPDQVIHPYFFGGSRLKRTCLYLKGFPKLKYYKKTDLFDTCTIGKPDDPVKVYVQKKTGKIKYLHKFNMLGVTGKERSKLDDYFAYEIAKQYSEFLKEKIK